MFELVTGILLLAQAFSPAMPVKEGSQIVNESTNEKVAIEHTLTLEQHVREVFRETPILAEIAYCESSFRQFNDDGTVLRGRVNKGDIGIMQINRYYHEEDAIKLGIDIFSLDGNIEYAKYLYKKYGSDPWVHSSKCWKHLDNMLAMK